MSNSPIGESIKDNLFSFASFLRVACSSKGKEKKGLCQNSILA